ncbi:MAG: hypothetical protein OEY66_07165 [Gammaproteobacteria bacterium]|nr:hypothetical protein [Gammaproteobacteria bacterium]
MSDIQVADNRIYVKDEVTYGTDSVPTATDRVRTSDLDIVPYDGPRIEKAYDGDGGRDRNSINTGPFTSLTCKVDFAGSGTKDIEPTYAPLLRSCGVGVVETALTNTTITTGTGVITDSSSIYFVEDLAGELEKSALLGVRGTAGLDISRGAVPQWDFSLLGTYNQPSHIASTLAGAPAAQLKGIPVTNANTATVTLDGATVCLESLKFDNMGYTTDFVNGPNCLEVKSSPTQIKGTIVIKDEGYATKNFVALAESHGGVTEVALAVTHGTVTGNILSASVATIQITDIKRTSLNGIKGWTMTFGLTSNAPLVIVQT